MQKMYKELAKWWHLVSNPAEYADEVAFFLPLVEAITQRPTPHLLELGSGGGNNAFHLKRVFSTVTLTDLSEDMLEMSIRLNPECEHIQGDMRTLRLDRTFDLVFVHDAIEYMLTREDLKQALTTAYVHCASGGMALFVPDNVQESFETSTDHGGEDGEGRGVRYMDWSYDPDPTDNRYITDYVFVFHEDGKPTIVEHDEHHLGLFSEAEWLELIKSVGFEVEVVIDPFERHVFVAKKP